MRWILGAFALLGGCSAEDIRLRVPPDLSGTLLVGAETRYGIAGQRFETPESLPIRDWSLPEEATGIWLIAIDGSPESFRVELGPRTGPLDGEARIDQLPHQAYFASMDDGEFSDFNARTDLSPDVAAIEIPHLPNVCDRAQVTAKTAPTSINLKKLMALDDGWIGFAVIAGQAQIGRLTRAFEWVPISVPELPAEVIDLAFDGQHTLFGVGAGTMFQVDVDGSSFSLVTTPVQARNVSADHGRGVAAPGLVELTRGSTQTRALPEVEGLAAVDVEDLGDAGSFAIFEDGSIRRLSGTGWETELRDAPNEESPPAALAYGEGTLMARSSLTVFRREPFESTAESLWTALPSPFGDQVAFSIPYLTPLPHGRFLVTGASGKVAIWDGDRYCDLSQGARTLVGIEIPGETGRFLMYSGSGGNPSERAELYELEILE